MLDAEDLYRSLVILLRMNGRDQRDSEFRRAMEVFQVHFDLAVERAVLKAVQEGRLLSEPAFQAAVRQIMALDKERS